MAVYSPEFLQRIQDETFVDAVELHEALPSTNSRALELVTQGMLGRRCSLILAEQQTAGRGRGANRWWSAEGGLTFSLLLNSQALSLPVNRWPLVSLTTGLAVCEAIDPLLGPYSDKTSLKWPNDVYLQGRKLCGILVEGADHRIGALVIGIGVNVNNSYSAAPGDLQQKAVALCDVLHEEIDRSEVLLNIVKQLETRIKLLADGRDDLRALWQERCLLTGRTVQIEMHSGEITGLCRGIDRDGTLLVETSGGCQRIVSGVVRSFE
jgi:BirA family transcriptional regulator, biotin operon repressor / biotin---[acetyl-CoA-carboxylase] ligase